MSILFIGDNSRTQDSPFAGILLGVALGAVVWAVVVGVGVVVWRAWK